MTRAIVSRGVKAHGRQQRIRWQYVRGSCFRYGQANFLFSCEKFGGDSILGRLGSRLPSPSKSSSPPSLSLCRFRPRLSLLGSFPVSPLFCETDEEVELGVPEQFRIFADHSWLKITQNSFMMPFASSRFIGVNNGLTATSESCMV